VLYASDAYPGRIYKLSLDGKVLGVLGQSGEQLKQFGWMHEIACRSENTLFVAELLNWRVQKLELHPWRSGRLQPSFPVTRPSDNPMIYATKVQMADIGRPEGS
jgi:hypothetical protein